MALEFLWLKNIDFFPNRPDSDWLEHAHSVCIGTKSRNLGDALALTTLPEKLKSRFRELKIYIYPRGFNPISFLNNPYIDGVSRLPDQLYGDDANWGKGQLIQLKEQFFSLPVSDPPKPKIYLSPSETEWIEHFIQFNTHPDDRKKPLCVIHPWGHTRDKVAPVEFWDELVSKWKHRYRFWQAGLEGHSAVQGCEYYFFLPRQLKAARKLFALLSRANIFIGIDSGPMHVARAFDVRSLIFLGHADPSSVFEKREEAPYFLYRNWDNGVLYAENQHINPNDPGVQDAIDQFLTDFLAP